MSEPVRKAVVVSPPAPPPATVIIVSMKPRSELHRRIGSQFHDAGPRDFPKTQLPGSRPGLVDLTLPRDVTNRELAAKTIKRFNDRSNSHAGTFEKQRDQNAGATGRRNNWDELVELLNGRVLVTGGAGFVGSNLVNHLLGEAFDVTIPLFWAPQKQVLKGCVVS